MKIDDNEQISIWLMGNTGLRNPTRIQEGFIAFSQSPFVGNLHGDNEIAFMNFLNEKGVIHNKKGKDLSGSHARKWRLMFERYGFIYGQVKSKKDGYTQDELGKADEITPFGKRFLLADTTPAMQEYFLRSLGVEQYWLPDKSGHFSPFRWILSIMLELEKRTGSSELSRIEFGLWGHTTNPSYDVIEVVDHILKFREGRKKAPSKRKFDQEEIAARGKHYEHKPKNFLDYSDMNMRYLRISGVLQRKGRGLIIEPSKHIIAEKMAKSTASTTPMLDELKKLTNGAPLPTDDMETAKRVLDSLVKQLKERHIAFNISDLSLKTPEEVNTARHRLEEIVAQTDEIIYAADQKNQWKEISAYMSLLMKGGGKKKYNGYWIEVPEDETPKYLEWVMWRAALAIGHLENKPFEVRGFKLDSDFLPVNTAGGGKGDLYWEFKDFIVLTEVTMSTSSRQEAMEGEPVRRHVSDAVLKYDKPVYGMFIAVRVDTNTVETFRHGIWYAKANERQRLNIVPFTLEQFRDYFEHMFETQQTQPEMLLRLFDHCIEKRDLLEAPAWKEYIKDSVIPGTINYNLSKNYLSNRKRIPENVAYSDASYSLREDLLSKVQFGTKIRDLENDKIGCVIGINKNHVTIAFKDTVQPEIQQVDLSVFEKDRFILA